LDYSFVIYDNTDLNNNYNVSYYSKESFDFDQGSIWVYDAISNRNDFLDSENLTLYYIYYIVNLTFDFNNDDYHRYYNMFFLLNDDMVIQSIILLRISEIQNIKPIFY
jgi:hypothetical protein